MSGNRIYALLLIAITAIILVGMALFGAENIFRLWNIPTQQPTFADLRILPGSAESFRQGFDPITENPADPFKRHFNYPRAWYIFFYTGIDQGDTLWMAVVLLLMFFLALLLFPGKIKTAEALMLCLVIFSPAVMLAVERGNVDLFVFFLCALTLISMDYSTPLAIITLMIASLLKLFPFFGVSIFLNEKRPSFIKIVAAMLGILVTYAALTYRNIYAALSYTEKGSDLSYGVNVIPLHIQTFSGDNQLFARISPISYLILLVLFILALGIGSMPSIRVNEAPSRKLNSFRMGASIYIGTFFLGNNWDYRLVFLLLVIPQLATWMHERTPIRRLADWALLTIVLSTWYLMLTGFWELLPAINGKELAFALDELANWALLALLTILTIASTPGWMHAEFRATFSRRFSLFNDKLPKSSK